MIRPDIDALNKTKARGKDKRINIVNVLNNIESILFHNLYFNYKLSSEETNTTNMTELESEESDADTINMTKLESHFWET